MTGKQQRLSISFCGIGSVGCLFPPPRLGMGSNPTAVPGGGIPSRHSVHPKWTLAHSTVFLPSLQEQFPRSPRELTRQTLFIWHPRSAITEAELRICSYQGAVSYILFLFLPLPESAIKLLVFLCLTESASYTKVWKVSYKKSQQKPLKIRGNMTSQKVPHSNTPCSSRGRCHEEIW